MTPRPEASGADADAIEIQAQVLQTTLAEVSILRQQAGNNEADHDDGGAGTAPDCCVICLDTISEPCTALPCSHAHFDFLCLLSWLQQRPSCPLCQSAVYKVKYTDAKAVDSVYRVPNAPRTRKEDESREPATSARTSWRSEGVPTGLGFRPRNSNHYRRRGPELVTPSPDQAIEHRRNIYRHKLYSLHVGSNRLSQYKPPPTPDEFAATPHLVSRARLWIRRELQVFAFLASTSPPATATATTPSSFTSLAQTKEHTRRRNNAEFLLEYIIAILKTVDMQGSAGQAEAMLSDFLGREHARLFLHELRSWLRSPSQTVAAWDREVQYPDPEVVCQAQQKRSLAEGEATTAGSDAERATRKRDDGGGSGRKRRHGELVDSEEHDPSRSRHRSTRTRDRDFDR
ncbi:hypothetical protein B0T22DRAFT_499287 [Podospora appendiculata]|uniref:RING-type E3 ubiquitin transferase n=1 Tax=Podospora appendiculata TaxID=314037 RepID=A0AAE0XBJ5_9PEZI|nr:hypothetical protein B0T22DRAFT_499287 [Podospora appendiculata]